MAFETLIQVDELRQHLGDAGLVIFDCRHDLMKPDAGAQAYAQSHIPGARFAHSDKDLSGPKTGKTGRHPLPEPTRFMAWLGANGVDASKQVDRVRSRRRGVGHPAMVDAALARS